MKGSCTVSQQDLHCAQVRITELQQEIAERQQQAEASVRDQQALLERVAQFDKLLNDTNAELNLRSERIGTLEADYNSLGDKYIADMESKAVAEAELKERIATLELQALASEELRQSQDEEYEQRIADLERQCTEANATISNHKDSERLQSDTIANLEDQNAEYETKLSSSLRYVAAFAKDAMSASSLLNEGIKLRMENLDTKSNTIAGLVADVGRRLSFYKNGEVELMATIERQDIYLQQAYNEKCTIAALNGELKNTCASLQETLKADRNVREQFDSVKNQLELVTEEKLKVEEKCRLLELETETFTQSLATATDELSKKDQKVEQLQVSLNQMVQDAARLTDTTHAIESKISELTVQLDESGKEMVSMDEEKKLLQEQLDAQKAVEEQITAEVEKRCAELTAITADVNNLTKQVSELHKELEMASAQEEDIIQLKAELSDTRARLDTAFKAKAGVDSEKLELEKSLEERDDEVGGLTNEVQEYCQRAEKDRLIIGELQETCDSLQRRVGGYETDLKSLRETVEAFDIEIESLEKQLVENGTTITDTNASSVKETEELGVRILALESELAEKESANEQMIQSFETIKRQSADKDLTIDNLNSAIETLNARISEYVELEARINADLEAVLDKQTESEERYNSLVSELEASTNELQSKSQQFDEAIVTRQALEDAVQDMKLELSKTFERTNELEMQCNSKHAELEGARNLIDENSSEVAELKAELARVQSLLSAAITHSSQLATIKKEKDDLARANSAIVKSLAESKGINQRISKENLRLNEQLFQHIRTPPSGAALEGGSSFARTESQETIDLNDKIEQIPAAVTAKPIRVTKEPAAKKLPKKAPFAVFDTISEVKTPTFLKRSQASSPSPTVKKLKANGSR
jgi:chromosome segregation ATPase